MEIRSQVCPADRLLRWEILERCETFGVPLHVLGTLKRRGAAVKMGQRHYETIGAPIVVFWATIDYRSLKSLTC